MASLSWDEADELCDEIIDMIEEDLPEGAYDKAPDFFEGVLEKTRSMQRSIQDRHSVTQPMVNALENMKEKVGNWFRD